MLDHHLSSVTGAFFSDAADRRLPALLKESREAQAAVSTALAEQVLSLAHDMAFASCGLLHMQSTSHGSPLGILTACAEALGTAEFSGYANLAPEPTCRRLHVSVFD